MKILHLLFLCFVLGACDKPKQQQPTINYVALEPDWMRAWRVEYEAMPVGFLGFDAHEWGFVTYGYSDSNLIELGLKEDGTVVWRKKP